jgi:MFS superfamily sulfate permease-like transporter
MAGSYPYASARRKPRLPMNRIPWDKILSFTPLDVAKILLSALIIVVVNKVQLFNDRLSALLIALPLTSLIAMIWMHHAGQSSQRLANHAEGTFWFVLPTLPMFLIIPWMLRREWGFWSTLAANCVITVALFWLTVIILRKFGIDLMPK